MAHNLYQNRAYIGRQAAWHTLGQVTGQHISLDELKKQDWLQYIVFKSQLCDGLGRKVNAWGTFRWNVADKLAGNKEAAEFLGAVGEDYEVIQHGEGMTTLDQLMATNGQSYIETAGVLGNGEKVWVLADLGMAAKVGNDVQKGFLLFTTGHDGSMSHQYRMVFERVVCENTLGMALSEKTRGKLVIRHTKNAMNRIIDARAALAGMSEDVVRMEDKLNFLAGRKLTREALCSVLDRLFPKQKDAEGKEKDTSRRTNILSDIVKLYELNDGDTFKEQRGTSYNLLNAITNWVDHGRSASGDSDGAKAANRAEAALFGSGDQLKGKALEYCLEVSKDLPIRSMPSQSISVDWNDIGLKIAN